MPNLIHLLAEVMDKEPSLVALWTQGLTIGLAGLLALTGRRRGSSEEEDVPRDT